MSPASCGAGVLGPQVQEDRDFQSGYFRGGGSIYVRDGERRECKYLNYMMFHIHLVDSRIMRMTIWRVRQMAKAVTSGMSRAVVLERRV